MKILSFIDIAEKNNTNSPCSFCKLCKHGKALEITNKTNEKYILCDFTLNRDIQIAFDSRCGKTCARFELDEYIEGFLDAANMTNDVNYGFIEKGEYNQMMILYPLPALIKSNSERKTILTNQKSKLAYTIVRHNSKYKWQFDKEKWNKEGKYTNPPFFIDWKYNEKEFPIFASIIQSFQKEITI